MLPTLVDGNFYKMEEIQGSMIEEGDIIVYLVNNICICHRVVKIVTFLSGVTFYKVKGDNCDECDPYAVTLEMIIGKIVL